MDDHPTKTQNIFSVAVKDSMKVMANKNRKKRAEHLTKEATLLYAKRDTLPPMKKVATKNVEEWSVKCLPSDWTPNSKPSKIIGQLTTKRQKLHEDAVTELDAKISRVNSEMEEKIRRATMIYRDALVVKTADVEDAMKPIRVEAFEAKLQFTTEYFDELIQKLLDASATAEKKLQQMMDELIGFEMARTDSFRPILKAAYEKLDVASHQLPFELREYFEDRIQGMNEITMNNARCYAELKTDLRLRLKNELRLHLLEVQSARERWIHFMKVSAMKELREKKLPDVSCSQVLLATFGEEHMVSVAPHGIRLDLICKWLQQVDEIVFDLGAISRGLKQNFQLGFVGMCMSDMTQLAENILALGYVDAVDSEQARTGAISEKQLEKIRASWSRAQDDLTKDIRETFVFLQRLIVLRNDHLNRLSSIEAVVLKDLHRLEGQNDAVVHADETKLNIAIDTLRQESEERNMTTLLRQIQTLLSALEKTYNSNFDGESKLPQKIADLAGLESATTIAELEQFLSVYSGEFEINNDLEEPGEKELMSSQIETCRYQMRNLKLQRSGLLLVIGNYCKECQRLNLEWASDLIATKKENLAVTLNQKLSHSCRIKYDRIKVVIYDVRLAELTKHKITLKRHMAGVSKQIAETPNFFLKHETKYDAIAAHFRQDMTNMTNKINSTQLVEVLITARATLKRQFDNCKKTLDQADEKCQREIRGRTNLVVRANLNYAMVVSMFGENGSFSWRETESICDELETIGRNFKVTLKTAAKSHGLKFAKRLQELGAAYDKLDKLTNEHIEELEFGNKCKNALKEVQSAIANETFYLKLKRKQLAAFVERVKNNQQKHLGVADCLEVAADLFYAAVEKFEEYLAVISRPEARNFGNYVARNLIGRGDSVVESVATKSTDVTVANSVPEDLELYKDMLFDERPEYGDGYISKIQQLVYASFERLQFSGVEFYSKHAAKYSFHRSELLQPNFDNFIIESLPKCICIYLQCEMAWLEETHEFIKMVKDFECFVRMYCRKFTAEYAEECARDLWNIYAKIVDQKQCSRKSFFVVHRRRDDKSIVDQLQQKIDDSCRYKIPDRFQLLLECKEDLIDKGETVRTELMELNADLEAIAQAFLEKSFDGFMQVQFAATVNYLQNILAPTGEEFLSSAPDVLTRVLQKLESLKTNVSIAQNYVDEANCFDDGETQGGEIPPSPSFEMIAIIQKYDEELDKILVDIDEVIERNRPIHQQCKETCSSDAEIIYVNSNSVSTSCDSYRSR